MMGGYYHNLKDFFKFPIYKKQWAYKPQNPLSHDLRNSRYLFERLEQQDILTNTPYQSYDTILRFFNEASMNKEVEEIWISIYRVAKDSRILHALISAAKNGKKVTVFVELKARFDEENNYLTAEAMQQAGIKIIYSLPGLKVHAKLAYIRKRSKDPEVPIKGYAYLSTGNFNEKTARIYSDMGLLTSNHAIIMEIDELFHILEGKPQTKMFEH